MGQYTFTHMMGALCSKSILPILGKFGMIPRKKYVLTFTGIVRLPLENNSKEADKEDCKSVFLTLETWSSVLETIMKDAVSYEKNMTLNGNICKNIEINLYPPVEKSNVIRYPGMVSWVSYDCSKEVVAEFIVNQDSSLILQRGFRDPTNRYNFRVEPKLLTSDELS